MTFEVRELSPASWGALSDLLGSDHQCSACWCMNHRLPPAEVVEGPAARDALRRAIDTGEAAGAIAWDGSLAVGWCAVDALGALAGHDYVLARPEAALPGTWAIHCLFVRPSHRGRGVSSALLAAAVEIARRRGAGKLLGFPIPEANASRFPAHEAEFSGRARSYRALGFVPEGRLNDFYEVVALAL